MKLRILASLNKYIAELFSIQDISFSSFRGIKVCFLSYATLNPNLGGSGAEVVFYC